MIPGQITIFELLETKRMCSMCKHFTLNECLKPNCKAMNLWTKKISRWEADEPIYQKWLNTPKETIILESQKERSQIARMINFLGTSEYGRAHHICKEMPDNIYAWLNTCHDNYFVFTVRGEMSGKHYSVCPYCGANLEKNEGDVVLIKTNANQWISHLYCHKPEHDKGYLTDEEHARYRIEMDKGFRSK